MQQPIFRSFKAACTGMIIGAFSLFQPSCATFSGTQRGALLVGAGTLAKIAATAAATYYGGPGAGELASAGLSALGSVLQGYVGTTIPSSVVQAAPGVGNVGAAVVGVIAQDRKVNQADVDAINLAAGIAANTGTNGGNQP